MAINVRFFLLPVAMFLLLFRNTELGHTADTNAITSSKKSPRQKWLLELEGGSTKGRRVLSCLPNRCNDQKKLFDNLRTSR